MHGEQKSPSDNPGRDGRKNVPGTHSGTANPQDFQLCLRSLSCLAERSVHEHALTINSDLYHILTGDSFLWENQPKHITLSHQQSAGSTRALGRHGMLPQHASGAQVSARPVLQGLVEDLNHTATFPQPAIHSNHVCMGICKIKQLST